MSIPELIQQKVHGSERELVRGADLHFHESEDQRLLIRLRTEAEASELPAEPAGGCTARSASAPRLRTESRSQEREPLRVRLYNCRIHRA